MQFQLQTTFVQVSTTSTAGESVNNFPPKDTVFDEQTLYVGQALDNKYLYTTHSELNAILNYRGGSLEGAKLYVTLFPCNECAKAIIQSGIKTVVYDSDKYEHTPSVIASKRMMDAAGIRYYKYSRTNRQITLNV